VHQDSSGVAVLDFEGDFHGGNHDSAPGGKESLCAAMSRPAAPP
jgi:hypothetical protein